MLQSLKLTYFLVVKGVFVTSENLQSVTKPVRQKVRSFCNQGSHFSKMINSMISPFLPSATKFWQGNIFTGVCQSFCSRRGEGVSGRPPQADTPLGRHRHLSVILFTGGRGCMVDPPARHPSPAATAADGTHPTGMHSCLNFQVFVFPSF